LASRASCNCLNRSVFSVSAAAKFFRNSCISSSPVSALFSFPRPSVYIYNNMHMYWYWEFKSRTSSAPESELFPILLPFVYA